MTVIDRHAFNRKCSWRHAGNLSIYNCLEVSDGLFEFPRKCSKSRYPVAATYIEKKIATLKHPGKGMNYCIASHPFKHQCTPGVDQLHGSLLAKILSTNCSMPICSRNRIRFRSHFMKGIFLLANGHFYSRTPVTAILAFTREPIFIYPIRLPNSYSVAKTLHPYNKSPETCY